MHAPGYFDANATTPLFPRAREVLAEALDRQWHNPSSLYHEGGTVRRSLEAARDRLAELLKIDDPRRIVFTSGATEGNNTLLRHLAITSAADAVVLISPVEHPCVRQPAAALFGDRAIKAPLELEGTADAILRSRPALVSVMAANNETGVLQPWMEIARVCRELGIPFHTDAAQWIGKQPLAGLADCDWVTASAHKFGGPKGTGFLIVPEDLTQLCGSALGGSQENGLRAGTENAPGVLAMVAALEEAEARRPACSAAGRDSFEARCRELVPGTECVGAGLPRLWNTSLCILPDFPNRKWLTRLSHLGFQVGAGSACSTGKGRPSPVLEAMNLDPAAMGRVIRASASWATSPEDWSALANAVHQTWLDLQDPASESRNDRKIKLP